MFQDGRSRKLVFLAHCFLNQNAISDGTAVHPAAFRDVVDFFLAREIGIVQLPCPELTCLGLDRGDVHGADRPVVVENTRIRHQMQQPPHDHRLKRMAAEAAEQIAEYVHHGFCVLGIVGANRSPNCGVDTTSDNDTELAGMGLFMQALSAALAERELQVPFVGLRGADDAPAVLARRLGLDAARSPAGG